MSITAPAPPPSQQATPPSQQALTAAIVLVLASGAPPAVMAGAATGLLAPLGVSAQMLAGVLSLLGSPLAVPSSRGTAATFTAAAEHAYRAAYLLAACRRLLAGGTLEQERVYARQHLAARHARRGAAAEIDATVKVAGRMLIWRAVRDSTTTAGCAAADGMAFAVDDPPVVEGRRVYPGQVHVACRCRGIPAPLG